MPAGRTPQLVPDSQFPGDALARSVQKSPDVSTSIPGSMTYTWIISSVADSISPWGRNPSIRDRQLRDFWPTESFLAGALADITFRNAAYDWEIRGASTNVENLLSDMLKAAIAGDTFGWTDFVKKFSLDLYTQDNGAFVELIRDAGMDANSRFKNEQAPVLGIAHMDSNQCQRTGNPEFPVLYTDREGKIHKLAWYQVIPFSEFPSPIEKMNSVGYCGVTRALRLAQIMRSTLLFKDEKISGRHFKSLHIVGGVSRLDIEDAKKLAREGADNQGLQRYIDPIILASLDPDKPVSTVKVDLASLPDGFDFDTDMKWYITALASCLGTDYQEFAPLPGGGIGSSNQSQTLNQKSAGKGAAMFMKISEAFKNYGVLPRGYEMIFEDRDEQRSLDRQMIRKAFQEEMALAVRNGVIDPLRARQIGIKRGIYTEAELSGIPEDYGNDIVNPQKQPIGEKGGNTIAQDGTRTGGGAPEPNSNAGLRKSTESQMTINNIMPPSVDVMKSVQKMMKENAINITVEPTPVTINIPQQPAPIVNIPQQPANIINVPMQPAPIIHVDTPKVKREVQKVVRDMQGNITETETEAYYE